MSLGLRHNLFNEKKFKILISSILLSFFIVFYLFVVDANAFVIANNTINQTPAIAPLNNIQLNFSIYGNASSVTTHNLTNVTIVFQPITDNVRLFNVSAGTVNTSASYIVTQPNSSTIVFSNASTSLNLFTEANQLLSFSINVSAPQSGTYNIFINTTINSSILDNSTTVSLNVINGTLTLTNATFSNFTYDGSTIRMNFTGTASSPTGGGSIGDNITYTLYLNNNLQVTNYTCGTTCTGGVGTANLTINGTAGIYTFVWNTTGTNNYTAVSLTAVLNISKATPTVRTFLSGTPGNITVTYPTSVEIRGNATFGNVTTIAEPTFNIYIFNVTESSPTVLLTASGMPAVRTETLGNGTYRIVYNTSGSVNYTAAENNTLYLHVNKGIHDITIYVNGSTNGTYIAERGDIINITIVSNATIDNITTSMRIFTNFTGSNATIATLTGPILNSLYNITNTSRLVLGNHTISANATETANYTSTANNTILLWVRDTIPPRITSFTLVKAESIYVNSPLTTSDFSCSAIDNSSITISITGLDTSSPGRKTATCQVTDEANNIATATVEYTVFSLSTVTTSTPSISANKIDKGKARANIQSIAANGIATVSINKTFETNINEIKIGVKNQAANVWINVVKLTGKPTEIKEVPNGTVFGYVNINVDLSQDNIRNATINFYVPKSWIQQSNIDENRVYLNRYADNKWNRLNTSKISDDTEFVYYKALTPGFSVFSITGEQKVAEVQPPPAEREQSAPPESPSSPPEAPPSAPKAFPIGLILIAIVIIAVVAGVFYLLRIKKLRWEELKRKYNKVYF
ncbi:MAG: PGF-pre-PGF domain-containing protein [Candidatus Aenigmatarchaeota archaeon]